MWFDNETESCSRAAEKFRHKTMHVCSDPLHVERETLGYLTVALQQCTAADVQELISISLLCSSSLIAQIPAFHLYTN